LKPSKAARALGFTGGHISGCKTAKEARRVEAVAVEAAQKLKSARVSLAPKRKPFNLKKAMASGAIVVRSEKPLSEKQLKGLEKELRKIDRETSAKRNKKAEAEAVVLDNSRIIEKDLGW
jgi:hypothetical protein